MDEKTLRLLLEDTTRSVERQLAIGKDIEEKSNLLLRTGALAISIVAAIAALNGQALPRPARGFLGTGALLMMGAMVWALRAQHVKVYRVGIDEAHIEDVVKHGATHGSVLKAMVMAYARGMRANRTSLDLASGRLRVAQSVFLPSWASLALAVAWIMFGAQW